MYERIVIVKDHTRLENLIQKFNTKSQAKFYIERNGGSFDFYENEHNVYYNVLSEVQRELSKLMKTTQVDKYFLSSFLFVKTDVVVVIGRDGLVANTGKYAQENPILAINPDPETINGTLLPFRLGNFERGVKNILNQKFEVSKITLAEASLNDGQKLLAFNDFYIGKKDHTSAIYDLKIDSMFETQSSSGILVSTGAGSTGWLSSVLNEANGLLNYFGLNDIKLDKKLEWDENRLIYTVREPYVSPYTSAEMVMGDISNGGIFEVTSKMSENGVIFSDGMINDFIEFNSGKSVLICCSKNKVKLVRNGFN